MTLVATAVDPDVSASLVIYEKLKPLKDALGVKDLSDQELQLFALVARHTGLDPFTKQIYAIKRQGRVSHQTGIDGYRSVAERTRQYAGSEEATFEACDCGQEPKDHPKVARVVVHRVLDSGHVVDQVGVARWHELYPGAGDVGAMWRKMPTNQLAKCAEANGLRKAFPRVLGGVYITDEMQGAETIEGEAREVPSATAAQPTARERIAARRAASETKAAPAEVEGESSWLDQAEAAEAPSAQAPAASAEPVSVATTILAAAAASDLEGAPSADQKDALAQVFAGVPKAVTLAGIAALWPEAVKGEIATLTAAQAAGILLVADSLEHDALVVAWQQLSEPVEGGAA